MARARPFQSQYWRLTRRANNDSLVFFQVGRFIEFYGPQRFLAVRVLKLRNAALARGGYAFRAGFPTRLADLYALRALRQGLTVVEVRQVSEPLTGRITRVAYALLLPAAKEAPSSIGR